MDHLTSLFPDELSVEVAENYRRRKTTSVLAIVFTDIARSTELREQLGEVRYESVREEHDHAVREIIEAKDAGSVVKSTGDGLLAVFAEPSMAVLRCLSLQKSLQSHPHFQVRIGIDMGQVAVASKGGIVQDVFGRHVNRAARITAVAEPKHILTSFQVYDCAAGWLQQRDVGWRHHGRVALKGFSEGVSLHEPYSAHQSPLPSAQIAANAVIANKLSDLVPTPVQEVVSGVSISTNVRVAASEVPKVDPDKRRVTLNPVEVVSINACLVKVEKLLAMRRSVRRRDPRILWVDDYHWDLWYIDFFRQAGCHVDLAPSNTGAMKFLQTNKYDLAITSMSRGEKSAAGIELLQSMKIAGYQVPTLVFCSSHAVATYGDQSMSFGALLCTAGTLTFLDAIFQVINQLAD